MKKVNLALNAIAFIFVFGLVYETPWQSLFISLDIKIFFVALIFCLLGFFFQSLNWFVLLKLANVNVSFKDAICSVGTTIFAKYIPGKVWMILGRASYLAQRYPQKLKILGTLSFVAQIISLVVAGIISSYILIQFDFIEPAYQSYILFSILGLIVVTFILLLLSRRWTLGLKSLSVVAFVSLLMWFFWGCGFAFMYVSMELDWHISMSYLIVVFTFAALIGILAVIVPGGIGIREAGLVTVLGFLGLSLELAISVAALSRVWFLLGESIFFVLCRLYEIAPDK